MQSAAVSALLQEWAPTYCALTSACSPARSTPFNSQAGTPQTSFPGFSCSLLLFAVLDKTTVFPSKPQLRWIGVGLRHQLLEMEGF